MFLIGQIGLIGSYIPDCLDYFRIPRLPRLVYISLMALIGLDFPDGPDWFRFP